MNIQLIAINLEQNLNNFQIGVLIGSQKYDFTLTVESVKVADQIIEGIRGDRHFLELFRLNQNLAVEIYHLVLQFYQGQELNLPINLGDFIIPEANLVIQEF